MGLKWLDLMEFLKPETSKISEFGAGAVGIITPNQTINVMTSNDGRGSCSDAKNIILNSIYDLMHVDNLKIIDDILGSIVTLKYSNQVINGEILRYVVITIPKSINWYQYETLCSISLEFDEIIKKYNLLVFAQIDGYNYNPDKSGNNLKKILGELAKRVNYDQYSDELLATVDKDGRFTTDNCVVKSM